MTGAFDEHERRMWAGAAEAYAESFARLCAGAVPELVGAAAIGPGVKVLDVGTGPGTVAREAVRLGADVVAVDAEPGMVALAAAAVPEAEVRHAVLPELPFADGAFDAVVGNFVVNHVERPVEALAELRRVVRPGGRIAVTIWHDAGNRTMDLFNLALDAVEVARPALPRPMDFARTVDGLAGLLAEAGWAGSACREVAWTHRPTPEEWWRGPAGGVANIGLLVTGQPAGTFARIKEEYDRLAGDAVGADGRLALPASALLATAVR